MDNKEELICEYCKVSIKENDVKCPHCGANCTKVINEYKKHKKAREEEFTKKRREMMENTAKDISKSFTKAGVVIGAIFIMFFCLIVFLVVKQIAQIHQDPDWNSNSSNEKKISVKYQEEAKTGDYNVTLDSYELYEYKSEHFPESYNTKNGYQKIAFHFIVKNNTDKEFDTRFSFFSLTADDYKVDHADLEKCMFCYTAVGKDSYQNLYVEIAPNEKMQGYVGYLVPKDAKKLKFKVGDYVTINMDNPVYEGE